MLQSLKQLKFRLIKLKSVKSGEYNYFITQCIIIMSKTKFVYKVHYGHILIS